MARRRKAELLLTVLQLTTVVAVNHVFDETLWSKTLWSSMKLENPLAAFNPSDEAKLDISLKETYCNSVDGPQQRRDPLSTEAMQRLQGFSEVNTLDDAGLAAAAAHASQCSMCHTLVTRIWQNVTVAMLQGEPAPSTSKLYDTMSTMCDGEAVAAALRRHTILKLESDGPTAVIFFAIRDRPAGVPPTRAERLAMKAACKKLIKTVGSELSQAVSVHHQQYRKQLAAVLQKHGLPVSWDTAGEGDQQCSVGEDGGKGQGCPVEGSAEEKGRGQPRAAARKRAPLKDDDDDDDPYVDPDDLDDDGEPLVPALGAKGGAAAGGARPEADAGDTAKAHKVPNKRMLKLVLDKVASALKQSGMEITMLDDLDEEGEDEEEDCLDLHPMCDKWANEGECKANPDYMVGHAKAKGHCRRACGACKPPKVEDPEEVAARSNTDITADEKAAEVIAGQLPAVATEAQQLSQAMLQSLRASACGASKVCMAGTASGSNTGDGFVKTMRSAGGFVLGKPFYGVPEVATVEPAPEPITDDQLQAMTPVERILVEELRGKVWSIPAEFFVYEFYFRNSTRHFHEEPDGTITEDWLLGTFQRESFQITTAAGERAHLDDLDLVPDIKVLMRQSDWPYVKQVYSGGKECVLAGNKRVVRRTEVRLACSPSTDRHMLVREPDFCSYIYVLYLPSLCKLEELRPVQKPAVMD